MASLETSNKVILLARDTLNLLGVVRGFGVCGIQPIGILIQAKTNFCDKSRFWGKIHRVLDRDEALETLTRLYSGEKKKPIVLPIDDTLMQMLDQKYEELSRDFILASFNHESGKLNFLADKMNQVALAHEMGYNMLPSKVIHPDDAENVADGYPIMLKPAESSKGGKTFFICHNEKEYLEAMETSRRCHIENVILQPYLANRTEYVCFGAVCPEKDMVSYTLIRNIRQNPPKHGVGCYSEIVTDPAMMAFVDELFHKLMQNGYDGPVDVEFFYDNDAGVFYINEFNWRTSGRNFVALYTKVYSNYWWYCCKCGRDFSRDNLVNHKNGYTIKLIHDVHNVLHHRVGWLKWLRQWWTAESHSALFCSDLMPVLFLTVKMLVGKYKRSRKK